MILWQLQSKLLIDGPLKPVAREPKVQASFLSTKAAVLTSASPGNLLDVQILRLHPRATEWEILGAVPVICVLTNPPGDADTPLAGESVLGAEAAPATDSSHTCAWKGLFLTPYVYFQNGREVYA